MKTISIIYQKGHVPSLYIKRLLFVCFLLVHSLTKAQSLNCDVAPNTPFSVAVSGGNLLLSYTNKYILTDYTGTIIQIKDSPNFDGVLAGNYLAYHINYDGNGSITNLALGQKINKVKGECISVSAPLAFRICETNTTVCDFVPTESISFSATGGNTTLGFTNQYLLTDKTGKILAINSIPTFPAQAVGLYIVYNVNIEIKTGVTGMIVNNNVTDIEGVCFELSAPMTVAVCQPCLAGDTGPVLANNLINNICPILTFDLNSLHIGTIPNTTILVWSVDSDPSDGLSSTVVNPSVADAGVYYAYYYDPANLCYSPPSPQVEATLVLCTPCLAGTTAPLITETTVVNLCPATTFSLAALANTGIKPAGTSLVWSTNKVPTSAGDTLTNLTTVSTAGKYYALYYDKVSNCYSPADSVDATITTCNLSPVITSGLTANTPENVSTTTPVYTVTATDPNLGQTQTYSLETGGLDNVLFSINPTTGEVTFVASPDFENPTDAGGDNVYNIKVRVCDNGSPILCAIQDVAITVTNAVECVAGTTAPTLSGTTASNTCPATIAVISGLVTSTCPSGSAIEWHNVASGFTAANKVGNPAAIATNGTYYPVCFDSTNNCYSPAPSTGVTVTINACGTVNCDAGLMAPVLIKN